MSVLARKHTGLTLVSGPSWGSFYIPVQRAYGPRRSRPPDDDRRHPCASTPILTRTIKVLQHIIWLTLIDTDGNKNICSHISRLGRQTQQLIHKQQQLPSRNTWPSPPLTTYQSHGICFQFEKCHSKPFQVSTRKLHLRAARQQFNCSLWKRYPCSRNKC